MKYLAINDVLIIHKRLIEKYGGSLGIRDIGLLDSSISQPKMTFDQKELYPTIYEKAGILSFSLIKNHSFIDGNKRIGHAAMEIFLLINGFEIISDLEEQERIVMSIAKGTMQKEEYFDWLKSVIKKII
jgi:death-on-curing protein